MISFAYVTDEEIRSAKTISVMVKHQDLELIYSAPPARWIIESDPDSSLCILVETRAGIQAARERILRVLNHSSLRPGARNNAVQHSLKHLFELARAAALFFCLTEPYVLCGL